VILVGLFALRDRILLPGRPSVAGACAHHGFDLGARAAPSLTSASAPERSLIQFWLYETGREKM
jgi:hypothetical protein